MENQTIIKLFVIIVINIFLWGCNSKPATENEFKEDVIGTWLSGGEEVMSGYTVKHKYEIRKDGTVVMSTSTNGGAYVGEVSMRYTIGSGM